jgi:hypothetical protein
VDEDLMSMYDVGAFVLEVFEIDGVPGPELDVCDALILGELWCVF